MVHVNISNIYKSCFLFTLTVLCMSSRVCNATKEKCSTCKDIAEHFKEGLEKTKKSNFGGGNTRWEEKSLGTWAHSETRLVEIWENYLCKHDTKECHFMLEKHEEDIEDFWFNVHAKDEGVDMHQWLCIDKIKVCCPSNTYGPKCSPCVGGVDRPCKGNGKCDGEGTREGTGKCDCSAGYQGDLCDDCKDGYFEESKNDTHTVCQACHPSCTSTCWEAGPKGCDDCKSGYTKSDEEGCQDVDECVDDPCKENQYCDNTVGSYHCATCHRSCQGCSGYGADKCESCNDGYRKENNDCIDINECEEDKTLCSGDKQSCENKEGSYECKCEEGLFYEPESKTCLPKPKDPPKPPKSRESKDKKDREKKDRKTDKDKPGFLLLIGMTVVFYICGSMVQWNYIVMLFLSIVFGVFIYWYGMQHDAL